MAAALWWRSWQVVGAGLGALAATLLVALVLDDGEDSGGEGSGSSSGFDRPVDPYAAQETNQPGVCNPVAQPGVKLFRAWALAKWGQREPSPENIVRGCDVGGQSEHKEGRAWDLMTRSIDHGQAIVDALLAPDPDTGEPDALARRAGIMYLIWNHRMWRAYPHAGDPSGTWEPYSGGEAASPHTDHIHFSFSRAGAAGETSLYDRLRAEMPSV